MKRLLALILFLLPLSASATTTVTGQLNNLGTNAVGKAAFVRFWLRGCGGNQPRVNGTAIIAPSQGGVFFFDLIASATGVISGTLYSTRDSTGLLGGDIECGGSHLSVWYGMQVFVSGKGGPEVPIHAENGVTLNITNVTPITVTPPPPIPSSGGGSVTGCTTTGGVLYENGTANTATCGTALGFDATGQTLFDSCTATIADANNQACLIGDVVGTITGNTNNLTSASGKTHITINTPNTSTGDYFGTFGSSVGDGTGTFLGQIAGLGGRGDYVGTGTVTNLVSIFAETNLNTMGGTVTNNFGFDGGDQHGVASTLNAAYYAPDQGSGANDYALYLTGGRAKINGYYVQTVIGRFDQALGTTIINSGACATAVNVTVTGADATKDNVILDDNATDLSGVTGYGVSASGTLTIYKRITTNTVTITVCNSTGGNITPGALTLHGQVVGYRP